LENFAARGPCPDLSSLRSQPGSPSRSVSTPFPDHLCVLFLLRCFFFGPRDHRPAAAETSGISSFLIAVFLLRYSNFCRRKTDFFPLAGCSYFRFVAVQRLQERPKPLIPFSGRQGGVPSFAFSMTSDGARLTPHPR